MTFTNQTSSERLSTADLAGASDTHTEPARGNVPVADHDAPMERKAADHAQPAQRSEHAALFAGSDAASLRSRWSEVQTGFVDEPRKAVEQADALVAEVMQRLASMFADERRSLEQHWDKGADTDTEQLRQALQRYRSFFDRLLAL